MTRPVRKEAERREQILKAATRVFERDGLSKASMRAIALEAGCTTGAIYPIFAGKEDIYASLLEQSLERLHAAVAMASAAEVHAEDALIAAATAWFDYYGAAPFESDLGLYLHGSGQARGLGPERDARLNALLLRTLRIFDACFIRLAPASVQEGEAPRWVQRERDLLFATLTGIGMLDRTGRTRSIGTDAGTLLQTALDALRERMGGWRSPG